MSKKTVRQIQDEEVAAAEAVVQQFQGEPFPITESEAPHYPPTTQPEYERPADWRSRWLPAQDSPIESWPTNIDLRSADGRMLLVNAGNPADLTIPESGELVLLVTHYLIYPDQIESQDTGELIPGCRAVFICKDGKTFKTTSEFGARKLGQMFQLFTAREWAEGLRVLVQSRKSRNPKRGFYHNVKLVGIGPA